MKPDYARAYRQTMGHEGGYVNDPTDRGGETYAGISRKHHPDWPGWAIVDEVGDKSTLAESADLVPLVRAFYREQYWDKVRGDDLGAHLIATEMFDTAVNMGPGVAIAILQQSLNILNRASHLYPDLRTDGKIGRRTLGALATYLETDKAEILYKVMNIFQGSRYLQIMSANPTQEKYARGWLERVEFAKRPMAGVE